MLKDDAIVRQGSEMIRKDFGLEEEWVFEDSLKPFDRLRELLASHINVLLDKDFNHLLNVLYRIDIDESIVSTLLAGDDVANDLSEAIIAREKEKIVTRLRYRSL